MYSTKEVSDLFSIHTNTVRFYDKMGFLSPVNRKENGYRVFTERHINQIHIIKLIFLKEWPGKYLRNESIRIINAIPEWDIEHIRELTTQYIISIKSEISLVEQVMLTVEKKNVIPQNEDEVISFTSAARKLGVTKETLRNWERNGLFSSLRNSSNRKFINIQIFEELKVIYCLRLTGFSMSFIYTYLRNPDQISTIEVYSAGDHLLDFLKNTLECAEKIPFFKTVRLQLHTTFIFTANLVEIGGFDEIKQL